MQESKRQKQVSGLIIEELNDIFRRLGLNRKFIPRGASATDELVIE